MRFLILFCFSLSLLAIAPQSPAGPTPERIEVYPGQISLNSHRAVRQLIVTGYFNGEARDLTSQSKFISADPKIVSIERNARRSTHRWSYLNRSDRCRSIRQARGDCFKLRESRSGSIQIRNGRCSHQAGMCNRIMPRLSARERQFLSFAVWLRPHNRSHFPHARRL